MTYYLNIAARNLVIVVFFIASLGFAQEKTYPELWMECVYSGYQDQGEAVKNMLADYEQELIDKGLLKDASAASYRKMLQDLQLPNFVVDSTLSSITEQITSLDNEVDNSVISACHSALMESTGTNQKLGPIEELLQEALTNDQVSIAKYAAAIDEAYQDEYFEYTYYKLFVFIGFELEELMTPSIEPDFELSQEDLDRLTDQMEDILEEESNFAPQKNFVVSISSTDQIQYQEENFKLKDLTNKAKVFVLEDRELATTFVIKYTQETSPIVIEQVEAALRDGIESAREAYAKKEYKKSFDKLDGDTKIEIVTMFPTYFKLQLIK